MELHLAERDPQEWCFAKQAYLVQGHWWEVDCCSPTSQGNGDWTSLTGASLSQVGRSLPCNSVTLGSLMSQNLFPHLHVGREATLLRVVEKIT